jgi:hypothetical protein
MDNDNAQVKRVVEYFDGDAGAERYERLLDYTEKLTKFYYWSYVKGGPMPGGRSASDVVNELLNQVLDPAGQTGAGRTIPDHVEVGFALQLHIKSKLSALSRSFSNRKISRETDLEGRYYPGGVPQFDTNKSFWDTSDEGPTTEERVAMRARCGRFIEFVRNDDTLYRMLTLIRDENLEDPAAEVAKRLDIDVSQIYAARRRMKTALGRFLKQEENLK